MGTVAQPNPEVDRRREGPLLALLGRPPACLRLADLPTPVERMPWLDRGDVEVWVKRDDLTSAIYGGGKVRKLEWILANPPYDGTDAIVSVGGIGSHHLLALALFLERLGRNLHALTFEQVLTPHVRRNLAVLISVGTSLWHVKTRARLPLAWLRYYTVSRPPALGRFMGPGASTPLGCLGFVDAGLELAAQIEAGEAPRPARVFVTGGTAGTSAGLVLGLAMAGIGTHVHIVSSVERWGFNAFMFRRKLAEAHAALRRHGVPQDVRSTDAFALLERAGVRFSIDHAAVGRGYGVPTVGAEEAIRDASAHGLQLETTYTGKCLAALRRWVQADARARGPILFWNTHAGNDLSDRIDPDWTARCPFPLPDA